MRKLIVHKKNLLTRLIIIILVLITLASVSCSARKNKVDQKNLIPEKDLVLILTDIHMANGLLAIPRINARYSLLDSISTYFQVIEKYGYTKEVMDNTMKYYFIKNPKKLTEIYDQVLGILSKRESGIEKEALIEQNRKSNIWTGKDFIVVPSATGSDSTAFGLDINKPGFYMLSFTSTVYPDDESFNPGPVIYSTSADSLDNGKRKYLKTIRYLKDGQPHYYTIMLSDPKKPNRNVKGWLFDFESDQNGVENHFKIENISITFSPAIL